MQASIYDTIVIGAGPAGITAALYLARTGISVLLVEAIAHGGQVLSTFEIDNYPGFPKGVKGYELADLFAAHLNDYKIDKIQGAVQKLDHSKASSCILVNDKEYCAKVIIVASGSSYKKMEMEGEKELTGKGISYCAVCDGNFYRNQEVALIGGGNSALEEALYLARIVSKVYLIHRRDSFRASKVYIDKVEAMPEKIEILRSHVIEKLDGQNSLEGVQVRNLNTKELRTLKVNGLFVFIGSTPSINFLPNELNTDDSGYIITDTEMRTNLAGIFAAGDIRSKHCRQVTSAVGDGATAATAAISYLELN